MPHDLGNPHPHRNRRDAPLTDVGFDARHFEDPEDRAVVREFVLDSMLNSGLETVGDMLDMLSNAGPAQRRELLNKCRVAAGLETVEDVEGHARFVQANEALLYRPHRPVPSCAVCGAHPTTPQGMPDPNIPAVRRRPSHHRDRLVRDQRDEQTHASEHAGARLEVTAADPDRELRVLTPGLLPQPGGCEGFVLVEEHLEVSRPATFDGPDVCQGEADRDTALPTDCVRGQESKHAPIGRLAHFFHLPPLIRPRLILFREPLPYASSASVGDVGCRSPVHYPFDPRTQELEVELACALPRLEACTDEFDVLLRHSPTEDLAEEAVLQRPNAIRPS